MDCSQIDHFGDGERAHKGTVIHPDAQQQTDKLGNISCLHVVQRSEPGGQMQTAKLIQKRSHGLAG